MARAYGPGAFEAILLINQGGSMMMLPFTITQVELSRTHDPIYSERSQFPVGHVYGPIEVDIHGVSTHRGWETWDEDRMKMEMDKLRGTVSSVPSTPLALPPGKAVGNG